VVSVWDDYFVVADDYQELDGERVLVRVRASGLGKASGVQIERTTATRQGANLFHLQGGSVTRLVVYFDYDRALADLGLTPD
jgi:hypothetical protein